MYSYINHLTARILPAWVHDRLIGRWNSHGFNRYFSNTAWALAARIFNTATSLFVSIYLIRYLGPENYGQLSYALSFIGLFTIISTLGIENILYRDLVKYPEKRSTYLGTGFVIRLTAGIAAAIFASVSGWVTNPDDVSRLVILLLSATFLFTPFNIIITEFQANVAQKFPSFVTMVVVSILNLLKIGVIVANEGILYVAIVLLIEPILYAVFLSYIRIWHYGSLRDWKFDRLVAKQMLIDAWPFILVALFTTVYTRVDQIMLKHLVDSAAVGVYDAAVRVAEAWLFLPAIIASSLFPAIVNAKEKLGSREYRYRLLTMTGALIIMSVILAIPLSLLARPLMELLFGPTFIDSAMVFSIYIWASVFIVADMALRNFLIIENMRKTIFLISALVAVLNIILNLFFIPVFGPVGAAWSTLIAYSIFLWPLTRVWKLG